MFLSKRKGIYYLWYDDDDGRKRKISTRARLKSDALKFLRGFNERQEAWGDVPDSSWYMPT